MNRNSFNAAVELQTSKNTQFKIYLLNGAVDFVKAEDLGTKGTVHVRSEEGATYRAIEKNLSFYQIPGDFGSDRHVEVKAGATILVNGEEASYDADVHFWIAPKAMWVAINEDKEAQVPFTAGIRIQISSDIIEFLNTDVRVAAMNIAGKMGKLKDADFSKIEIKEGSFGLTKVKQHEDKTVEIAIDAISIKKVVTYVMRRIDDCASVIGFFLTTGIADKVKNETKELNTFIMARHERLGK